MNFDKLEQAIIRYRESLARFRRDREDLRAFGVTDLPGDAPTYPVTVTGDGSPAVAGSPVLPWKPSWEMLGAARKKMGDYGFCMPEAHLSEVLSAAAAVAPKPAPGNLPGEPTDAMFHAAAAAQPGGIQISGRSLLSDEELARILRAALAAAPRVEVPEVTEEDVAAYNAARHKAAMDPTRRHEEHLDGLLAFRESLIARMGAQS